jgi:hypothetical protein
MIFRLLRLVLLGPMWAILAVVGVGAGCSGCLDRRQPRDPILGRPGYAGRSEGRGGDHGCRVVVQGLPGTFDVINLILDSPNVQGMWTNRLVDAMPNRSLSEWEEMREMRFKRFTNYWPASRN